MYQDELVELFKKHKLKNTNHRHMLYMLLKESKQPISAEEIYRLISVKLDKPINLSTVYRILETFEQKGLVLKSQINLNGKALYEINHMEHRHHLICIKCNKISPIKGCPLGDYEIELEKQTGYKILEHNLEIKGLCPSCQKT